MKRKKMMIFVYFILVIVVVFVVYVWVVLMNVVKFYRLIEFIVDVDEESGVKCVILGDELMMVKFDMIV